MIQKYRFLYVLFGLWILLIPPAQAHRVDDGLAMEKPSVAKDEYERKVLKILDDISKNQNYLNVPEYDGRLLRVLAEGADAKHIVEVGTSNGYSTIWLGLAVKKTGGTITTYEIDPERAANARANFKRAEMDDIITVIEGDAHEKITALTQEIDVLFLDADKVGYLDYLEKTRDLIRPGGLIIGHNITPNMVDPAFVEAITTDPELETVIRGGVSISVKKR